MSELKLLSAGTSLREIDLSGADNAQSIGVPAGIIGTALEGPAFVPITVATFNDFMATFGETDGVKFGPLAVYEWLRNSLGVTYLRVLGVGKGETRRTSTPNPGSVESAGFTVGEEQSRDTGNFGVNPYANSLGIPGRTHFLGAYMIDISGSTGLADAYSTTNQDSTIAQPILRGVLMAASGVVPMLSSSLTASAAPTTTAPAGTDADQGELTGSVDLSNAKQEFVMLLNGHKAANPAYPGVITASFDMTAPNYFANIFNTDPYKMEEAGYVLYTRYDIHSSQAVITGTGLTSTSSATEAAEIAFLTTGSLTRDLGSSTVPNYEGFEDRYATADSPWIISQKFGGAPINLFKIKARSDGAFVNDQFKISIENIAASTSEIDLYGTFDVVVRAFGDNDDEKSVLESYRGLSLDPSSEQFVAKIIGDKNMYFEFDRASDSQKLVEEGSYSNKSRRIRVVLADDVINGDAEAESLPVGFRGPRHLVTSGSAPLEGASGSILNRVIEPPVPFRENLTTGVSPKLVVNKNLYWGVQFQQKIDSAEPNKGLVLDETIRSFTKYFPKFHTSYMNVHAGDNAGVADVGGTILDSDRFNNNQFSLENIQVVTGTDAKANLKETENWTYVRRGSIVADETAKTRALDATTDLTVPGVRALAKFSFFVQSGFDGTNIFNEQESKLSNRAVIEEMDFVARGQDNGPTVRSYRKALDIMKETSDVDIKLLAIPGIRHNVLTDVAITTAETRFDALFIMDIEERDTLNSVVTSSLQDINVTNTVNAHVSRALDSSFAAAYFPDVILTDPTTGTRVQTPPSVAALGALALNDAVAHPWWAPAGYTRGRLSTADQTVVRLKRENMDDLSEADVNPIVAFPGGPGITIWGQKTLLAQSHSLDRVSVRRLLLDIRRRVRLISRNFMFEPNRADTLERFQNQVNPVLQRIQEQAGVTRYRVRVDTETTTQADIDNNTIRGYIVIQPTKTAEHIALDFVITNAGVDL